MFLVPKTFIVLMNHISLSLVGKGAHSIWTICGNFNHTVIDLSVILEKGGQCLT